MCEDVNVTGLRKLYVTWSTVPFEPGQTHALPQRHRQRHRRHCYGLSCRRLRRHRRLVRLVRRHRLWGGGGDRNGELEGSRPFLAAPTGLLPASSSSSSAAAAAAIAVAAPAPLGGR